MVELLTAERVVFQDWSFCVTTYPTYPTGLTKNRTQKNHDSVNRPLIGRHSLSRVVLCSLQVLSLRQTEEVRSGVILEKKKVTVAEVVVNLRRH
jgi:hypothetical protein